MRTGDQRIETRVVGVILGMSLVLLPILLVPSGWDAWRFPKILVLRSAAILLWVTYGLSAIWLKSSARAIAARPDQLARIALFIIFWLSLSCLLSPEPSVSMWAVFDVVAALTLFFSARRFVAGQGSLRVLWLFLLPTLVTIVVVYLQREGIWQPLVDVSNLRDFSAEDQVLLTHSGLMGNRDDVGVYLLMAYATTLAFVRVNIGKFAPMAAVILIGIMMTTTITAIGVALALTTVELVHWARKSGVSRWWVGVAIIGLSCAGVIAVWYQAPVRARLMVHYLKAGDMNAVSQGRLGPWLVAARLSLDHPFFGVGPGRFPFEYNDEALAAAERHPEIMARGEYYFDMVHNDYLEIAAEAGIPVLIASVVLMLVWFGNLRRAEISGDVQLAWRRGAMQAAVCLGVAALTQFPLQLAGIYGSFAIIAGGASGLASRE